MHYFLSAPLGYKLTGIEHSILKRVALYNQAQCPCKIVTLNFSTELNLVLDKHELAPDNFINLYQFYQGFTQDRPFTQAQLLVTIPNPTVKHLATTGDFKVYSNGQYIMYVHCFTGSDRIAYINYFDQVGRKIKRELYDYLGYKSLERTLGENQVIISERYFDEKGLVFLEHYPDSDQPFLILHEQQGRRFFNHMNEWVRYWLEAQCKNHVRTYLYLDKNRLYAHWVGPMQAPNLFKFAIIHSTHVRNPNQEYDVTINSNYRYCLTHAQEFDALVVATETQRQDMLALFELKTPIYVIPPSYLRQHRIHPDKRKPNRRPLRILSTGRYAVEKRLDHMIHAIKMLAFELPDITLELYGFGPDKDLNALIVSLGLTEKVTLKGYSAQIKEALYQADLSLVTSKIESFCIAILDSLEQGTPVIAYDIKYGPAAMIQDGYNGSLVTEASIPELAQAIKDFYQHHRLSYTHHTQAITQDYDHSVVLKKWAELVTTATLRRTGPEEA
ncbi:MAG: glycosyltransferase [Neisseriaceae bacterium]|nr:glycosyltransferase [Neisseriaceae bacterium]